MIEQIMVLAIIAILASVATPSLHRLLARNQVQVAQRDFIGALQHARATAVTSGQHIVFCPTLDAQQCSGGTRWDDGWLLARDGNHDNQPDQKPLYSGAGYGGKLRIYSSVGRHVVRFHPDGSASGSNLTLLFCDPNQANHTLSVVVSNAGRVRGASATPEQEATCMQSDPT
ncbi:MAG: GspH/FimT family pseudopilin [Rhodanobacter sp.]